MRLLALWTFQLKGIRQIRKVQDWNRRSALWVLADNFQNHISRLHKTTNTLLLNHRLSPYFAKIVPADAFVKYIIVGKIPIDRTPTLQHKHRYLVPVKEAFLRRVADKRGNEAGA